LLPRYLVGVAGGLRDAKKAIDIFVNEIDLVMSQIGCPSLAELGPDFLWTDALAAQPLNARLSARPERHRVNCANIRRDRSC
jgi:hypothetical protein